MVQPFEYNEEELFSNIIVSNTETVKNNYLCKLHVEMEKPILFIGTAGTAKTTYVKDFFKTLDKERTFTADINFNNYTDSLALQNIIMSNVNKLVGQKYGPPPTTKLIYFMDDMNMPLVDVYGTQAPICLIRQLIDYKIMYDRDALEL